MSAAALPPIRQKPGAGLPWPEWAVLRFWIFPRACRKLDWPRAAEMFQREGEKVLALWDALTPPERLAERVLIPRLRGIEDSSRDWSVAMTVEHLNIVGNAFLEIIQELRAGRVPPAVASTASVKPRGATPPAEVRAAFVRMLADAVSVGRLPAPTQEELRAKYRHPWFGPIDAHAWHCLNGIHQRLHRTQIESILARLPAT